MGSKITKKYKPPSINTHHWQHTHPHPIRPPKPEHGRFQILINKLTNQEVEQYEMAFDECEQLERYIDLLSWRERQEYIVSSRYLNCEESKQFCTRTYQVKAYIDHIPVRLSDIQDIPFPQNLYLLYASLQGLQKLYQIAGYFKVMEDFICMDKDGKVKVWFNSDLSKSTPSYHSDSDDEGRSDTLQHKMVDQIVSLIQENTTEDSQAEISVSDFIKLRHRGKGLSFKKCKQEIINYALKCKVSIPNYFQSVIGIFDDQIDKDNTLKENSSPQIHSQEIRPIGQQPYSGNQVEVYNSGSIINTYGYREKVTNQQNDYSSSSRVPSFQQRPDSSFFNQYQGRTQTNYMSSYYPRAQSPIDKLPPARLSSNYSFTNKGVAPQLAEKRSEATKAASYTIPNQSFPILNIQYPVHSSSITLHNNTPAQWDSKGLKGSVSHGGLLLSKRVLYSDSYSSYQLDAQLVEDMIRYQFL